jgi:hypothetical protein
VYKTLPALFACWIALSSVALADCRVHRGDRVVLYGTTDDPSVLMWDTSARLRAYNAASFDVAQAMSRHAMLVSPGTRGEVASCIPNYVTSPLFATPDDAVGVTLTSGPSRGTVRWVLGTDVRPAPKAPHGK